ncbi:MAG: ACT domain-containing protein [Chloroflexi bacterium OHK40]
MTERTLTLRVLPGSLAVCRLAPGEALPAWATSGGFWSITRTLDELSVVCAAEAVPEGVRQVGPWRALQVAGPLDFALTGILSALATPLAAAGLSLFAIATYDTDYLLVRAEALEAAVAALRGAGHHVLP